MMKSSSERGSSIVKFRKPCLVGIMGGSGAGKTWLANELEKRFEDKAVRLSLDDFYKDRSKLSMLRRSKLNFDHPRAIDWALVESIVADCAAGKSIQVPCYHFESHSRLPQSRTFGPKALVIMDGLWLIRRRSLRKFFACTVYLECPSKVRLERRLKRDVGERGRTPTSVRFQFNKTVAPMHRRFVEHQKRWADFVFSTVGPDELRTLTSHLELLLQKEAA